MPEDAEIIACASLPASRLAALADLRREPGVTVTLAGDRAWVRWEPNSSAVLDRLRPIAGAELYALRGGLWRRLGHRLPAFGLPTEGGEGSPIHRVVVPLAVQPESPGAERANPIRLALVSEEARRPATAMDCPLDDLGRWAETAPAASLASLLGAISGDRVLVRGARRCRRWPGPAGSGDRRSSSRSACEPSRPYPRRPCGRPSGRARGTSSSSRPTGSRRSRSTPSGL